MGAGAAMGAGKQVAQMASGAGGGKGGGGGGGGGGQGVSPQEAALAQYTYQQGLVADASRFANTHTGISTMSTQAAGGTRIQKALDLARRAQSNANAIDKAQQSLAQTAGTQAGQQAAAQDQQSQGFSDQPGSLGGSTTQTG